MKGRLLSVDGDMYTTYHEEDGKSVVQTHQDLTGYIERNKRLSNEASENWKGDMHLVADIPLSVIAIWRRELGDNPLAKRNRKWLFKKLNDPEFSLLRTKRGRI